MKYELTFAGAADTNRGTTRYPFPRYKRVHRNIESARAEVDKVFQVMRERGLPTACHSPTPA